MRKVPCYLTIVSLTLAFTHPVSAETSNRMSVGELTSQPTGHYEFCKVSPRECRIRSEKDAPRVHLTDALWADIMEVNLAVNKSVKPVSDYEVHGKDEVWSYPKGVGDCEDYVLEKRRMLHEHGVSLANLLVTVVRKPDGEGHAVLTIRAEHADLILDNLTDEVKVWRRTKYRFLKRQASFHTGRWVDLGNLVAPGNVASSSNNR